MKVPAAREVFFPSRLRGPQEQLDLEQRLFRALRLANGTYKTTYPSRLHDVDALFCGLLSCGTPVRVLDVGISSGVTTLELIECLEAHGIDGSVVAVDATVCGYLRRVGGLLDVLSDSSGNVLQLSLPLLVKCRPHDPASSPKRALLQGLFRLVEAASAIRGSTHRGVPVKLLSRRLLERSDVEVVEHDLSVPRPEWGGRFHAVRAANILNLSYFDTHELTIMLGHLASYLRPGGLLMVCRTPPEDHPNQATIFRRTTAGELVPVARYGAGSEIESLAAVLQ